MSQTLRFGDRSGAVRELQRKLNIKGAKLAMDGAYGDATEAAVRVYQRSTGLVADGIAGPKTLASLTGTNCGHLLKDANLVAAAERLGVELAAVYAVNEVESLGEGFSTAGPRNAYIFHARSADGRVADATAISPAPAEVVVTVQSVLGNGAAAPDLLAVVGTYLNDDDRRPVADRLAAREDQHIGPLHRPLA